MSIISAQAVYENDDFSYELGLNPKLEHCPTLGERGEVRLLTNQEKYCGAAGIFLCAEMFQEIVGRKNFYILPSSIHELILVVDSGTIDKEMLNGMVKIVNEEQVVPEERLADHVYYFDWGTKQIYTDEELCCDEARTLIED